MSEVQNTETTVQVENKVSVNTDKNMSSATRQETTRTYIAQLYVWAFFIVIGIVFIMGIIKEFTVDEFKDMLVTISGVLSGPLGFIVGYYFKASKE
ncbi:hypothetical protein [Barnesiella intestinihominis]|uniref:hypothetical protein n=1 Tax=Barnesiella intestinihominis TaxID=487174 RepID=UPI0039F56EBB